MPQRDFFSNRIEALSHRKKNALGNDLATFNILIAKLFGLPKERQ
jgi:hypothetical protein